jgi:hypothetical protein
MFDRYVEFLEGVLDECAECKGVPIFKYYPIGKKGMTVECTSCGQLVGPKDGNGLAMAAWNTEQRRIKHKRG